MDSHQARQILALYRPGSIDADDSQMAEALELLQRDPELAAWFEQQCATQDAIRAKLKSVPIPQNLRQQILHGRPAAGHHARLARLGIWTAAAAALAILTAILWATLLPPPDNTFANYRDRMARMVQRAYPMKMLAADQAQIREYFRTNGLPADFSLPAGLEKLPGIGGAALTWHNHPVSLLCLDATEKSDNAEPRNPAEFKKKLAERKDLYLFMASRTVLPEAPAPGRKPEFLKVGGFMTATWTVGDRVYLLTAPGEQPDLQKYLE